MSDDGRERVTMPPSAAGFSQNLHVKRKKNVQPSQDSCWLSCVTVVTEPRALESSLYNAEPAAPFPNSPSEFLLFFLSSPIKTIKLQTLRSVAWRREGTVRK